MLIFRHRNKVMTKMDIFIPHSELHGTTAELYGVPCSI